MTLDRYKEAWIKRALDAADDALRLNNQSALVSALSVIPSDLYLLLYFDRPSEWRHLSEWLPHLPSEGDQKLWAGNHGLYLMQQASVFVDDFFAAYGKYDPQKIRILDYGCGWGRMLRLLYGRAKIGNIHGADPWEHSLDRCRQFNVHAQFGKVDYLPKNLPFKGKFDIIFMFSVFTHLSEEAQLAILDALRKYIAEDGLLAVTIRQYNYWGATAWPDAQMRKKLLKNHVESGFAFVPHGVSDDSHQTLHYGDTSQTLEYIEHKWKSWKIQSANWRMIDEYQTTVYLRPA